MRWLLGLPLVPLLLCGGMCLGGALVALVLGKKATDTRQQDENAPAPQRQDGRY